jgi:response regulator RpfG family c-di-GMP phosphodiesterase/serine/threonine protein kinase
MRNLNGHESCHLPSPSWPTRAGLATNRLSSEVSCEALLYELLGASLILAEDWEHLSSAERENLLRQSSLEGLLTTLVECGLLTTYQAARIGAGHTFGLVLGNFRILERLGKGGMAIVYKAEHIEMRHLVAIKVLQLSRGDDPRLEMRFSAELRTIARLRHPNIVWAMDAGRVYSPDPDGPVLWYLVMEYVPGEDLDAFVRARGPLPVAQACNIIHQIASALVETNKLHLVHRDIKPSNILVTPEEQAKLLDFGLTRHTPTRLTQPGTVLGTIDYMSPEQARDASMVDIRADIYSLGGTLFWALTGQLPFPDTGSELEMLIRRLTQQPPALCPVRPELPHELEVVVQKMMSLNPDDRYSSPQEVLTALLPFLRPASSPDFSLAIPRLESAVVKGTRSHRVLIVDDEPGIRMFCKTVLQGDDLACAEAECGSEALKMAAQRPPDLVLLDVNMKGLSGPEVLRELRANPPLANLKVIMLSGMATGDELACMMLGGADDYLTKPFSVTQLASRVETALRLKYAQDRSDLLNRQLLAGNADLERALTARDSDLAQVRTALVLGLARIVALRENDSDQHLARMQRYCRCLAEEAARMPSFSEQINQAFIEMLTCCAPLHDIGKVGLPDHILLKPGKLQQDERLLMQAHTTIPADILIRLGQEYGAARAFLQMAGDIIHHHHERYDGTGYPEQLSGAAIPLAARIVAVADVYDALRSRRSYKPALSHSATVQLMCESSPGQFDPALLQAFQRCAGHFERIFKELPG